MAFNPFNQGVYNSTPPTLTSGQESQEQLDVNGNVKVAVQGNPADNVAEWGGAALTAPSASTPPAATDVGPTVRSIARKVPALETNALLAANATYTGTWHDTAGEGTICVGASAYVSSGSSVSNGFQIQQTDDTTATPVTVAQGTAANAATTVISAPISQRYWRILFHNGGVALTGTFEIFTSSMNESLIQTILGQVPGPNAGTFILPIGSISANALGDGAAAYYGLSMFGTTALTGALGMSATSASSASTVMNRTPNVFKTIAAVSVTSGTPVAIWTPASGKKFRLMGYALSLSVVGSVILDDSATEIIRTPLMAGGIGQSSPPMGNGILSAAANNALKADVSASGTVSGFVFGTEE